MPHYGLPPAPHVGPGPAPAAESPGVTGWTLLDAGNGAPVATFSHGAVINLRDLPPTFHVRADVAGAGGVSAVRFGFEGNRDFRTDTAGPMFTLHDDHGSGAQPWAPLPGTYAIAATPVLTAGGTGRAMAVDVTFVDEPVAGALGASARSVRFDRTEVGQTTTRPLTLTNLGAAGDPAINVTGINLGGEDPTDFATDFSGGGSGARLAPGQSLTFTIRFVPIRDNERNATLTVAHTGQGGPLVIDLVGPGAGPDPDPQPAATRQVVGLDPGWKFHEGDVAGGAAAAVTFDDSAWKDVSLPHNWNEFDGQDGGDDFDQSASWYRRHVTPDASMAGRELFLNFDGAYLTTEVFVNGTRVGEHRGGFAAFTFDVTAHLLPGQDNVIAVKVDNRANDDVAPADRNDPIPGGPDFTLFGGLYRGVDLIATDPVHVTLTDYGSPGVYLTQRDVSRSSATVDALTKVKNDGAATRTVTVRAEVRDGDGTVVEVLTDTRDVPGGGTTVDFSATGVIESPRLWDGTIDPYLYKVQVTVLDGSTVLDRVEQPLGLRSFRVDPGQGFFLNGRYYDLHGVNYHQDRLNKGWATSKADKEQDVALMEEMGVNYVRLVHYQHAETIYDLLDEAGIVAWTEIPLIYNGLDSPAFRENIKDQLRELIRQNYNHPSVVFWGLYNGLESEGVHDEIANELNALAHAEDPSRLTAASMVTRAGIDAPINHVTDVIGYNNYFGWYRGEFDDFGPFVDDFREQYPDRPLGVAEYGAGASINQHEENPTSTEASEGQFHPEEFQNEFHEAQWAQMRTRPWLWAKSVWAMFDFAADQRDEGELPGRNDKGLVTYDRATRKDSFYFYKSNWNPDEATVYITSRRFTDRPDDVTDVKIYSSMDSVTLRVNGVSLGAETGNDVNVFEWAGVQLRPGANTIEATGTRNGQTVTDTVTWNV